MIHRRIVDLEHLIVCGQFRVFSNFADISANKNIALFVLEKQRLHLYLHVCRSLFFTLFNVNEIFLIDGATLI